MDVSCSLLAQEQALHVILSDSKCRVALRRVTFFVLFPFGLIIKPRCQALILCTAEKQPLVELV